MIKVMVVDDHQIMREGLKAVLSKRPDFEIIGEAADGSEAVSKAAELRPDIILMDVTMPYRGLQATIDIMKQLPETKIIMLTISDEEEDLTGAIKAGAKGYLLKNTPSHDLLAAVKSVAEGGAVFTPIMAAKMVDNFRVIDTGKKETTELTSREIDVLFLVAHGDSNKEIARQLNMSEPTVKAHIRNILGKLHLKNRSQAAVYASQRNLIPPG